MMITILLFFFLMGDFPRGIGVAQQTSKMPVKSLKKVQTTADKHII